MSRNIFSLTVLAAMLVVLVAGNVQAQMEKNDVVTASATVKTVLNVHKDFNVNFGAVAVSTTPVLSPNGIATSSYVGQTASIGKVTITSQANAQIRISWITPLTLSDGASNTLSYALKVAGDDGDLNQGSAPELTTNPKDVTPQHATYVLWIGGTLGQIPANQPTGTYSNLTDGIFTVEYN
jgi:hypothetical protein